MKNGEFEMTNEIRMTKLAGRVYGCVAVTMQLESTLALTTNHHVAEGILPAVEGRHPAARTCGHPFLRVNCFDAIAAGLEAPALRQAGCPPLRGSWAGNRQWQCWEKSVNGEPFPARERVLPHPGGEGRGEGEREFPLNCSGFGHYRFGLLSSFLICHSSLHRR